jgi:hypothetical protein
VYACGSCQQLLLTASRAFVSQCRYAAVAGCRWSTLKASKVQSGCGWQQQQQQQQRILLTTLVLLLLWVEAQQQQQQQQQRIQAALDQLV